MKTRLCFYLAAFLVASGPALAQEVDIDLLIDECESCHGAGGQSSQQDIPSLAGRDGDELMELLQQFYYYERHCTTTTYRHGDKPKTPLNMCNVANTMSADEKKVIADYFAAQPAN